MKIEENERYTFYSLALEKNDALSDTYPVVMQIMPRDRVIEYIETMNKKEVKNA